MSRPQAKGHALQAEEAVGERQTDLGSGGRRAWVEQGVCCWTDQAQCSQAHVTIGHSEESALCPWAVKAMEGLKQSVSQGKSL